MTRLTGFTWLSVATVLLLGCQAKVIGGGSGGSGGVDVGMTTGTSIAPDTASSTGTGAPPSDDGPAIAMLRSELPAPPTLDGSSGITSTSGGAAEDPNSLFVFLSNVSQSCGDPFSDASGCATAKYQVTIVLPPALQAVGTYSLDQLAAAGFSAPEGGNVCSGGGGSYWDGTIAITAIDATHVDFTLAGTGELLTVGSNANGTYSAKRCF